jgi:hypothetical protein
MQSKNNPERNRPADVGTRNDPDLKDQSAAQPGVNTMSSSEYDDDNQNLTKTAAENFTPNSDIDEKADPDLDDINGDDDDDEDDDDDDNDDDVDF